MSPLYPDGVYRPLPRFSKNTQTNIAPRATRNNSSARSPRGTVMTCVGSVAKVSPSSPFSRAMPGRVTAALVRLFARGHRVQLQRTIVAVRRRSRQQRADAGRLLRRRRLLGAEAVLGSRECTDAHLVAIPRCRVADHLCEIGIFLHELRRELGVHAQKVVDDEHLPVALHARADADGRDVHAARDLRAQLGGNRLENERIAARLLERPRVGEKTRRLLLTAPLHHIAAHLVYRLRG